MKERKVASKNVYSFLSAGLATVTPFSIEGSDSLFSLSQPGREGNEVKPAIAGISNCLWPPLHSL